MKLLILLGFLKTNIYNTKISIINNTLMNNRLKTLKNENFSAKSPKNI
jgi:hypothetical protein